MEVQIRKACRSYLHNVNAIAYRASQDGVHALPAHQPVCQSRAAILEELLKVALKLCGMQLDSND
jgi:hypothetical protein